MINVEWVWLSMIITSKYTAILKWDVFSQWEEFIFTLNYDNEESWPKVDGKPKNDPEY